MGRLVQHQEIVRADRKHAEPSDNNVHFQDAVQLIERLIRLGKDFDLMVYPVERHGFVRPSSWIDEYERILEFFEAHLQEP